jgi:hypothetical protein
VGGEPTWIQGASYPVCAGCTRTMSAVGQLAVEDVWDAEGPVAGRGAWNVKQDLFNASSLAAGGEAVELAVPARDVEFLGYAVTLLNGGGDRL